MSSIAAQDILHEGFLMCPSKVESRLQLVTSHHEILQLSLQRSFMETSEDKPVSLTPILFPEVVNTRVLFAENDYGEVHSQLATIPHSL